MSAADSQALSEMPSTAGLSPEARALLAELDGTPVKSAKNASIAAAFHDTPQAARAEIILAAPHDDPKAEAFADMLNHLDDEAGTPVQDEAAALRAAQSYRAERSQSRMRSAETQDADVDFGTENISDAGDMDAMEMASADGVVLSEEEFGDADDELDFDFEIEETAGGLKGFFKRLGGSGGRAVKKLVGVKDATSAYNAQSGATLLPFTIIRTVVLVLVAAVPPIVNLSVIQPQISDNNRKITETLTFEARAQEDQKVADKLGASVANVDRRAQALLKELMPEERIQPLVNNYVAALQRYGVELNSYNVGTDAERKIIIGDIVQDAVIVEMDMVSRYDVYSEIRKIFVEEANKITVISETAEPVPGSVDLKITSRFMVPVRRGFDAELDKPQEGKK